MTYNPLQHVADGLARSGVQPTITAAVNDAAALPTAPTGYHPWRGVLAVPVTKGAVWFVPCVVSGERRVYDRRDLRVWPIAPVGSEYGEPVWVEAGRVHAEPEQSSASIVAGSTIG